MIPVSSAGSMDCGRELLAWAEIILRYHAGCRIPLFRRLSTSRIATNGHIEEWTIRNRPDGRNHPRVVDVIVFQYSGIYSSWSPAGKNLVARIVRREICPENSPDLSILISYSGMNIFPLRMIRIQGGMNGIKPGMAGGTRNSDEWRAS